MNGKGRIASVGWGHYEISLRRDTAGSTQTDAYGLQSGRGPSRGLKPNATKSLVVEFDRFFTAEGHMSIEECGVTHLKILRTK